MGFEGSPANDDGEYSQVRKMPPTTDLSGLTGSDGVLAYDNGEYSWVSSGQGDLVAMILQTRLRGLRKVRVESK